MIVVHSVGPYRGIEVYWGVEYDPPVYISRIGPAWLVEDLPPYRRSRWGAHLRLGGRVLHFGTCTRAEDPHRKLPEVPVNDISQWRGPHVQEEGGADPGGEQVRPDVGGRPVRSDGVEPGNGDLQRGPLQGSTQ